MKDKLNRAMNDISDKLIEEAANADRLENNRARMIRNIVIPVASVAAVAGLCIGLGKLGVFDRQGVDLVDSSAASASTTATTVEGPLFEIEGEYTMPSRFPLVSVTKEYVEGVEFGKEYPRPHVIYADETEVAFVDGAGGVYVYGIADEQISFSANIGQTLALMLEDMPQGYSAFDAPDGVEIFADNEGRLYVTQLYTSPHTYKGSGKRMTVTYQIADEGRYLKRVSDERNIDRFDGIMDISGLDCAALYPEAALIGDTDRFVFIRNCTADYDLLPMYDMERVELMWMTEDTATAEPTDGGILPFEDFIPVTAALESSAYVSGDGFTIQFAEDGGFDIYENGVMYASDGEYRIVGDILVMYEKSFDFSWLYRIEGGSLYYAEGFAEMMAANPDHPTSILNGKRFTPVEMPQTSHGVDALCDRIYAANEPENILSGGIISYHIGISSEGENTAVGDMWVGRDHGNVDSAENMFFPDGESLLYNMTVEDNGGGSRYVISSVTADDENGMHKMKKYYIMTEEDGYLIDRIEVYNVATDGTEALDSTVRFSYTYSDDTSNVQEEAKSEYQEQVDYTNKMLEELILNAKEEYADADVYDINDMRWPLDSEHQNITSYFGYDVWKGGTHYGIDISDIDIGHAKIYSAQGGIVIGAVSDSSWSNGLGNHVVIYHGNGFATMYAHCTDVFVSVGEQVGRGDAIATVGTTGWSTGNHLHFEVSENGVAVNPFNYPYDLSDSSGNAVTAAIEAAAAEYTGEFLMPDNRVWCLDAQYNEITETIYGQGGYYGHKGMDIRTPDGAAIYSMADGEVVYADYYNGYGNCVIVKHDGGYISLYAHCSALHASEGDMVSAGQKIAETGSTGFSTGYHLHLEVLRGTENIDPSEFFPDGQTVTYAADGFFFETASDAE